MTQSNSLQFFDRVGRGVSKALVFILLAFALLGCGKGAVEEGTPKEKKPLVVFLVRHGEKAELTKDPELSKAGEERALALAKVLRSTKLEHIHSSNYIRTRKTATPTAKAFGLATELYDPRNLEDLVSKLRTQGGTHLVVGHSTTTPRVVELLGGTVDSEIDELGEFDRLYVVMDVGNNRVQSTLMRYGR